MDTLLIGWIIVTVALVLDMIIPDPIPFIDEIILWILFFVLLLALFFRNIWLQIQAALGWLVHPAVIAFAATLIAIILIMKFKPKKRRSR